MARTRAAHGTIRSTIEYWPSYVDILTTVLMVFILQSFMQTTVNIDTFESAQIREAQRRLKETMQNEFSSETAEGKMTLDDSVPNLLQVRFSSEILFKRGDYQLEPKGELLLSKCARVLQPQQNIATYEQIEVQGHADNTLARMGKYPRNNWELSSARALRVVEFLLSQGIPPVKLSAGGYAEYRPVDRTGAHPELNRRIELRILFATPDPAKMAIHE